MKRRITITSIALEDIERAAEEICIYGYPLLVMNVMRRMHTAASHASSFDFEMLPADTIRAMQLAVPAAQAKIAEAEKTAGFDRTVDHWLLHCHPGQYQRNYLTRAAAA